MLSLVIALQEGVWLKQFEREKSVFKSDKSIKKNHLGWAFLRFLKQVKFYNIHKIFFV